MIEYIIQASRIIVILGIMFILYFDPNEVDHVIELRVGKHFRKLFIASVFAYMIIMIWQVVGIEFPTFIKMIKYAAITVVVVVLRYVLIR